MTDKSLDKVLEFFEECPEEDGYLFFGGEYGVFKDNKFTCYETKEGHTASWKHEEVIAIAISHDRTKFAVFVSERGMLEATESAITMLTIHKLVRVY